MLSEDKEGNEGTNFRQGFLLREKKVFPRRNDDDTTEAAAVGVADAASEQRSNFDFGLVVGQRSRRSRE